MDAIELKLGPVAYRLVFDNAAAFAFEEEYRRRFGRERGIFQFLGDCAFYYQDTVAGAKGEARQMRGPSLTEMSVALWALANTHHVRSRGRDAVTVEKMQSEMKPTDYVSYLGVFLEAISASMPKLPEGEAAQGGEPAPLAGT